MLFEVLVHENNQHLSNSPNSLIVSPRTIDSNEGNLRSSDISKSNLDTPTGKSKLSGHVRTGWI